MSSNYHRRCANCGKTRAEDMTITFHRFPKPGKLNIIKAQTWAKYCWPIKDWTSMASLHSLYTSNKVLCGRHFSTSLFYDSERQKLSIYAVPDIIDPHHSSIIQESDVKQIDNLTTVMPLLQEASTSFTQIENEDEQISKKNIFKQPSVGITNTSKPTTIEENAHYFVVTLKSGETREQPHCSKKRKGILGLINVNKISDLTPREFELYKICQKGTKEIRRLRKLLKNKKATCVKKINRKKKLQEICNLNNKYVVS